MSRFGTINGGTANGRTAIVQGADVESLGAAALLGLVSLVTTAPLLVDPVITSMTLAGAGDGHQFFIEIEFASAANVTGGLDLASAKLFVASTAADLQKQIAAFNDANPVVDVQMAGASKGRRVAALVVSGNLRGGQTELLSRVDLSVNDAYVEGPYTRTPILHAQPGGNVAGGFNGGGIGSKSILGFRTRTAGGTLPISGLPLADWKTFQYTWRDLSPPTGAGLVTDAYANIVVDMLGDGSQFNIFVIDPAAAAGLINNTTVVNPDGTSTTTFDVATHFPIIITPPAIIPAPAHTVGLVNSYSMADVIAAYPNAVLREADTGDGGFPVAPTNTSPVMLITGDSANTFVRAFLLKDVKFNGANI